MEEQFLRLRVEAERVGIAPCSVAGRRRMDGIGVAGRSKVVFLALAGGAIAISVVGFIFFPSLKTPETDRVVAEVRASGALGPAALVAFLIAQAVIAPLPSPPLLMAAGLIYGPVAGFGIGWVGLLLGASACFGLARAFGRPFAERFVATQQLAAVDTQIAARSGATFLAILSLRVLAPPAFDAVSYACGLLPIRFGWFAAATALGEVPKVASFTYLGAVAGNPPAWLTAWIMLVPLGGLVLLCVIRWQRHKVA